MMPLQAVFEQGAWVACAPANIALIKPAKEKTAAVMIITKNVINGCLIFI